MELRFKDRSVGGTSKGREPQAEALRSGTASQGIMPWLLAGTVGLGGGGLGTQLLNPSATPEHIARLQDKMERAVERLEDKIDEMDDKIDEVEKEVRDLGKLIDDASRDFQPAPPYGDREMPRDGVGGSRGKYGGDY